MGTTVLTLSLAIISTCMLTAQAAQAQSDPRPLNNWSYDELYEQGGIRVENLMDAKVLGVKDNEIGTIANVILDEENQIVTLIAEVGGMWDSGDRHVSIPWDEAELIQKGVRVPVREDNIEDYNLFNNEYVNDAYIFKGNLETSIPVESDVMTGPRIWKVTDIINDFASLGENTGVGYITDALFSRDGVMQAIVVNLSSAEFGKGYYAYPFYGHPDDWQPSAMHYELPYSRDSLSNVPNFDYKKYTSLWDS